MNDPGRIAAAIDIGSNTFKLTVARIRNGRVKPIAGSAEVVRLSEGIGQTGLIRPEALELAITVLKGFVTFARYQGAETITAVATEAVRTARNGSVLLARISADVGIDVQVIDGEEEAQLTSEGVLAQIDPSGSVLIVDIGGGSTELIATRDGLVVASVSLPVGSGILTDEYIPSDPPTLSELNTVEYITAQRAGPFLTGYPAFDRLILVGGVGQFLMTLLNLSERVAANALDVARDAVLRVTAAELAPLVNAPVARARVLPAGFAIARSVNVLAQSPTIEAVGNGLRIGMLLRVARAGIGEEASR
jgi:exopolyphosphatase/guanosine-5'-triphosphate,3'-diphosphate pyrophosphatase